MSYFQKKKTPCKKKKKKKEMKTDLFWSSDILRLPSIIYSKVAYGNREQDSHCRNKSSITGGPQGDKRGLANQNTHSN